MADWWEPFDVMPPSVLGIPSLLREQGRISNEECKSFPDGNRYKNLVSDRCKLNAATDDSEAVSAPTVIAETPSQSNPTKESRYSH